MAGPSWNDGMSVGVAYIDGQHQRLFGLIGRLHDAMSRGEGGSILSEIIDGLIDYTNVHFAAEEAYFGATAYPDSAIHKWQHQDFIAKVVDFKKGLDEGRLMLTLDVMDFLGDWLVEHIQGSDASYAPYLKGEGVS